MYKRIIKALFQFIFGIIVGYVIIQNYYLQVDEDTVNVISNSTTYVLYSLMLNTFMTFRRLGLLYLEPNDWILNIILLIIDLVNMAFLGNALYPIIFMRKLEVDQVITETAKIPSMFFGIIPSIVFELSILVCLLILFKMYYRSKK